MAIPKPPDSLPAGAPASGVEKLHRSRSSGGVRRDEQKLLADIMWLEAWVRTGLALLLVAGIFLVVIWAIGWSDQEPQEFALLLTPLVGLAGIAIGYFFGQGAGSALVERSSRLPAERSDADKLPMETGEPEG